MKDNKENDKFGIIKRVAALLGVLILVALIIMTLVFAVTDNKATMSFFKASFAMMIMIPALIFGYQIVYRALKSLRESDVNDKSKQE